MKNVVVISLNPVFAVIFLGFLSIGFRDGTSFNFFKNHEPLSDFINTIEQAFRSSEYSLIQYLCILSCCLLYLNPCLRILPLSI